MSLVPDVWVKCDACGEFHHSDPRGSIARRNAKTIGWVSLGKKDFCPRCRFSSAVTDIVQSRRSRRETTNNRQP